MSKTNEINQSRTAQQTQKSQIEQHDGKEKIQNDDEIGDL